MARGWGGTVTSSGSSLQNFLMSLILIFHGNQIQEGDAAERGKISILIHYYLKGHEQHLTINGCKRILEFMTILKYQTKYQTKRGSRIQCSLILH